MGRKAERRSGGGAEATRAASAKGDLVRPGHHRVALVVEAPPPGAPGELEVLARGEHGPPRPAVLGEAFDDHRPGRHVDAQRERLGGEDDLEQPGGEALLHRLAEQRDQPGVVRRQTRARAPRAIRRTRGRAGRRRSSGSTRRSAIRRMAARSLASVRRTPSRSIWRTASSQAARLKMKTMAGSMSRAPSSSTISVRRGAR